MAAASLPSTEESWAFPYDLLAHIGRYDSAEMRVAAEVQQQQQYELTPKWVVAQVMHVVDNIPSSDLLPINLNISPACRFFSDSVQPRFCSTNSDLDCRAKLRCELGPGQCMSVLDCANARSLRRSLPFFHPVACARAAAAAAMQCSILRRGKTVG